MDMCTILRVEKSGARVAVMALAVSGMLCRAVFQADFSCAAKSSFGSDS